MLPPRARAIFWNMRIKIHVWIWGRFFILGRFSLEVSSKMECARTRFLSQSNFLELCPDWPEKRPSKSIYKTNEILTFWLHWPSDVAIRVSRSCFFFLLKWCKSTSENPFSEGEAYFWRCHNAFGATLTDVSWKMHMFFFMGISVELMKSQGDFPHKWIFGNRHISCSSWVCFRRHQNGVHQTPLSVDPNEHKLLTWLQPRQNAAWCHCQK